MNFYTSHNILFLIVTVLQTIEWVEAEKKVAVDNKVKIEKRPLKVLSEKIKWVNSYKYIHLYEDIYWYFFNSISDKDLVPENNTILVKDLYEELSHEKKREKRQRDENVDREKDLYVSLYVYSYLRNLIYFWIKFLDFIFFSFTFIPTI